MSNFKFETKTLTFIRTNRGIKGVPCLWENEKLFDNMTTIKRVLKFDASISEPLFISTKNNFCLTPIKEGNLILKLFFEGNNKTKYAVSLLRILDIDKYSNDCKVEIVMRKNMDNEEFIINNESELLSENVHNKIHEIIKTIINK